jgi:hypothetical protein
VAAGLRTFVNAFTVVYTGGGITPTFAKPAPGSPLTLSSSAGTFTLTLTSSNWSLANVYAWINGSVAGDGGTFVTGFSATGFVDTTGRAATTLNIAGNAPSAAFTQSVVSPVTFGTILDVHSDILAWTLPATALPQIDNRSARFIFAKGVVEAAPLLLNGSGSFMTDCGVRNMIHLDISNLVNGGTSAGTPTDWGGVCSHFVWQDNTVSLLDSVLSLVSMTFDAYCNWTGNYFDQAAYSVRNVGTATFDGSATMTLVTGRMPNIPQLGYVISAPASAAGAIIQPVGTSGTSGNGGAAFAASINSSGVLNVQTQLVGTIRVDSGNRTISGTGVPAGTHITAFLSGINGGYGTYQTDYVGAGTAFVTMIQDGATDTYELSQTVVFNSTPATVTVKAISYLSPQANVYRIAPTIFGSETTNSKGLTSPAENTLFNFATPTDYSPIANGPLKMLNGEYAGALLPTGDWKV